MQLNNFLRQIFPIEKRFFDDLPSEERMLISEIRLKKLTYLAESKLASITKTIRDIEDKKLPGIMLEAGCALGGSAILISLLKKTTRPFYIYDVFGMIPPPTNLDGNDVQKRYQTIKDGKSKGLGGDKYYGYEKNLFKVVLKNLQQFGVDIKKQKVTLVKGLLQDTMKINQTVAFAHIDVDWYESVKTCLERIVPKLVVGGVVILDDYNDWSGCRKAVDEYFKDKKNFSFENQAALKITKIRA